MYVVGKDSAVFALDAVTGKEIWRFDTEGTPTNRGFNYWENNDRSDRRLIFASRSYLQEIDARTREADRELWHQRPREPARGPRPHPAAHGWSAIGIARSGLGQSARARFGSRRGLQLTARRHPGVRRADRQAGVDVPHDSPARRVRLRHVAARRVEDGRRRQHLGRVRRSTRNAASGISQRDRRRSICGAAIEKATTSSATPSSPSICARASVSGTIRRFITICGTTIW